MPTENRTRRPDVKLDFRSGGWVILLSLLIVAGLIVWRVVPSIRHGQTPYCTYQPDQPFNGFDLSICLVPRDLIVAGMPRDTLLPLDDPPVVAASQVGALNRQYRKYLLPADRVIGVVVAGVARAYPLRVLAWHEVCNDTLAGQPIAVTYSPLCDSAVVFDRRASGHDMHFAVSGLLYNSNLLMYDTPPQPAPASLWCQLQFRAIAGPAATKGAELTVLPAQVVYWADWQQQHPDATVVAPDPAFIERYNREPYSSYFGRGQPRYPVQPLPASSTLPLFEPVIAVEAAGARCVYPLSLIASLADVQGRWTTRCGETTVRFGYRDRPPNSPTARVDTDPAGPPARIVQSFWFAWHAMHPQDSLAAAAP